MTLKPNQTITRGMRRYLSTINILRDYQEECIKTSIEKFKLQGIKRQAVSLPVGAGKTVILSNLIAQLQCPTATAKKVLVLAHREELLLQACNQIRKFNPEKVIELEKGEFKADVSKADVIVASVPTLGRRDGDSGVCERLKRFDPNYFKCIIIDEAHHSAAPSYRRILEHFGALCPQSHLLVWGCSATMRRNDHQALGDLFEKVVYHMDMNKMINDGWLCRPELFQVFTEFNVDEVTLDASGEDFSTDDLSLALNTPKRNNLIAETWMKEARDKRNRKSTLVFAINVAHIHGLAQAFQEICGVTPKIITGKTDVFERAQILTDFAEGRVPVVINCGVLSEGTDLPRIDCILLARPTCNSSLYIQMTGRGLRTHQEKDFCLILDVIDKLKSPKRSLVTFPNLMAAQEVKKTPALPDESESMSPNSENKSKNRIIDEINSESVQIRVNKYKYSAILLENERLAWVKIPSFPIHVLDCLDFQITLREESEEELIHANSLFTAILKIKRQEDEEGIVGFERISSNLFNITNERSMAIVPLLDLIDEFIKNYQGENCKTLLQRVSRTAFWRRFLQPSPKQLLILLNAAKKFRANEIEISAIYKATMGQAADAITRIKYLKNINCPIRQNWSDIFN